MRKKIKQTLQKLFSKIPPGFDKSTLVYVMNEKTLAMYYFPKLIPDLPTYQGIPLDIDNTVAELIINLKQKEV